MTVSWAPPGPGRWELETSHFGGRMTPFYGELYEPAMTQGVKTAAARYGAPFSHLQLVFVNDRPYVSPVPLVRPPGSSTTVPPAPVVWLLTRLHPAFRARDRAAKRAFETKLWREDGRRWETEQKPAAIARCLALQDEDVASIDDQALAYHVSRACENFTDGIRVHFELIGTGIMSADFLVEAERCGIEPEKAAGMLAGASPASAETKAWLEPVARAAAASGTTPRSLEDLRALGPQAADALDRYLRHFGHRTVAGFDLDSPTLDESPGLVVSCVAALARETSAPSSPDEPATSDPRLAEQLAEARYAYGLRDDNSGITLHWTAGLLRRALLEAARRLLKAGRLHDPSHVLELRPDEVRPLLLGAGGPSADEIAERATRRRENEALDAPAFLGEEPPPPPMHLLPRHIGRVGAAALMGMTLLNSRADRAPLEGVGIGELTVRGRARVARSPQDALARLEPGDILVAPYTTPAYNAVLPIVRALVVEEGGALSHAAIVAREFGIPAVIGALGAVDGIPDGAEVEVDPAAGRVRVL